MGDDSRVIRAWLVVGMFILIVMAMHNGTKLAELERRVVALEARR